MKEHQSYESRFISFSNKVERMIVGLFIVLTLLIFLIQGLFMMTGIRHYFVPTDQLEGRQFHQVSETSK